MEFKKGELVKFHTDPMRNWTWFGEGNDNSNVGIINEMNLDSGKVKLHFLDRTENYYIIEYNRMMKLTDIKKLTSDELRIYKDYMDRILYDLNINRKDGFVSTLKKTSKSTFNRWIEELLYGQSLQEWDIVPLTGEPLQRLRKDARAAFEQAYGRQWGMSKSKKAMIGVGGLTVLGGTVALGNYLMGGKKKRKTKRKRTKKKRKTKRRRTKKKSNRKRTRKDKK